MDVPDVDPYSPEILYLPQENEIIVKDLLDINLTGNRKALNDAFLDLYKCEDRTLPSAIRSLKIFFELYPNLIYTVKDCFGEYKIYMSRNVLIEKLKTDFPTTLITSFERSLKHAGLEVEKSTRNKNIWKIWKIKVIKPCKPKKRERDE